VDAQGHGIISAKIASTVHDTFHALMLSELDWHGRTTRELFERINLQLARSVTARNALGRTEKESAREIATMLYGQIHPHGYFRFVNRTSGPARIHRGISQVHADPQGSHGPIPSTRAADPRRCPDRNRYFSMEPRNRGVSSSDVAELTLMSPGDILFLYTDGVYDGYDEQEATRRHHPRPLPGARKRAVQCDVRTRGQARR